MNKISRTFLLSAIATSVISCSGGTDVASIAEADISGTGDNNVSSGNIDSFGSVFVNGVRYVTDSASIIIDGDVSSEDQLQLGQIVIVSSGEATDNQAIATEVRYTPLIEGAITGIDEDEEILTVLGQNILTGDFTVAFGVDFDDLQVNLGDFVEASGFYDNDGNIVAAFIRTIESQDVQEIVGDVSVIDDGLIAIGDLRINTSDAVFTPNDYQIAVGDRIDITGNVNDTVLTATHVTQVINNGIPAEGAVDISIEGFIKAPSTNSFTLSGLTVQVNDDTVYANGTADSLATAEQALVTGVLEAGVIVADAVAFDLEVELELAGNVDAVDIENRTISIFGIAVSIPLDTLIVDEENNLRTFNIQDISLDDFIELEIAEISGDEFIALIVKREPPEESDEISGPIQNLNRAARTFEIFDLSIDASGQDIVMDTNEPITLDQFFENVQEGDSIEVKGGFVGDVFVVELIEP